MANNGCINGRLDGVNYSSPVPVIGFYIAAASFLFVALMLYDTATGFRARKPWLPCKSFSLNSVTLTILSIVTKLPVDLTTSMPSRWDQISKLTGTAVICITMGFLSPCIGVNSESECLSNMVALSIFVITVAANICIQLYTGVIVLFFVEHIIILILMLLLLLFLWRICLHIKSEKKITTDRYNNLFIKGKSKSMFGRLKLCYLYAYCSNPQFTISMHPTNAAVSTVCLACSIVVIQAAFRSLILKQLSFCQDVSDYGLSMPYIIVAQLLTVIVGTFTILYRWLSLLSRMDLSNLLSFLDNDDIKQRNQTVRKWFSLQRLKKFIASLNIKVASIAQLLTLWPSVLLQYIPGLYKLEELEYFRQLDSGCAIAASSYMVRKSVKDIIRLSELCNKESLIHLPQLLSQISTSQDFTDSEHPPLNISDDLQVCSLSMALVVKIAQVSIPKNYLRLLLDAFKEAEEIILFIDNIIQPKTSEDYDKFSYAEAVWTGGDFTCLVPHDIGAFPLDEPAAVEHALEIMQRLKARSVSAGNVWSHLGEVVDFINLKEYSSVEDLYTSIEQLFIDMLHIILAQLPAAIFKSLNDSSAEEFEDRVQLALKFLFKTGSLEKRVSLEKRIKWWFPKEYNISCFLTDSEWSKMPLTGALAKLEEAVPKVH